jgi:KTSC domain-containing protein
MEKLHVSSSTIIEVGYDSNLKTLEIQFSDTGTYRYFGVPITVFNDLMNASSKSQYFKAKIKDRFSYMRVE